MPRARALQSGPALAQKPERHGDGADVLTQVRVCYRLGISDETWRRWRAAGKTPEALTMPNGRLVWRTSDIDAMVGIEPERPGRRRFFATAAHARTVTPSFGLVKTTAGASTRGGR